MHSKNIGVSDARQSLSFLEPCATLGALGGDDLESDFEF